MTKTIQIEPDDIAVIANRLVRRLMADQYLDPKYWVPAVESLADELHNYIVDRMLPSDQAGA